LNPVFSQSKDILVQIRFLKTSYFGQQNAYQGGDYPLNAQINPFKGHFVAMNRSCSPLFWTAK
jgi:hypothetical protein